MVVMVTTTVVIIDTKWRIRKEGQFYILKFAFQIEKVMFKKSNVSEILESNKEWSVVPSTVLPTLKSFTNVSILLEWLKENYI